MPEKNKKTFKDVRGCDECKGELEEVVEYLKNPSKFTRLGGKLPKGILLTGPPGTGKTLLAKATAGEAGVPFFYRSGSEFEEMFVGVGARRVRSLFAAAKKKSPCIIFIDEIDAVGGNRKSWGEHHNKKTLNQLLVEMDGFEENKGIIVIAATNLPETLDKALTRPGRFDRTVHVPLPDISGRKQILDLYLKNVPIAEDVETEIIARTTVGFTGADLANLVNTAACQAAKNGLETLNSLTLDKAKDRILMGAERKTMVLTDESRHAHPQSDNRAARQCAWDGHPTSRARPELSLARATRGPPGRLHGRQSGRGAHLRGRQDNDRGQRGPAAGHAPSALHGDGVRHERRRGSRVCGGLPGQSALCGPSARGGRGGLEGPEGVVRPGAGPAQKARSRAPRTDKGPH